MNIKFMPDGTVEGLATPQTREFLGKLGEITEFGDSDIKVLRETDDFIEYEVFDELGHNCSRCDTKTSNFLLRWTPSSETIVCLDCQPNLV